jgi:hypothetical protein
MTPARSAVSMLDSDLQTKSGAPDGQFAYETPPTDFALDILTMWALASYGGKGRPA